MIWKGNIVSYFLVLRDENDKLFSIYDVTFRTKTNNILKDISTSEVGKYLRENISVSLPSNIVQKCLKCYLEYIYNTDFKGGNTQSNNAS